MTKFGRITRGEGRISRGQPRPYHKRAMPQHSNFGGSLLFMHTPFDAELPNFDVAKSTCGEGVCFWDQSRPHSRGTGSKHSLVLGVYAYTLCHRTTKFDGVTHGEKRVPWGQPHLPS